MYKQTETHEKAILKNGAEITPIATLEDEHGGRAHIWIDDHCYVLGLEEPAIAANDVPIVRPTWHIFPEAFQVMKTLPDLKQA